MNYNNNSLVPYITADEYDAVAEEFLQRYCPEALKKPMAVPIEEIARDMGLDVQYITLSEEQDIYGITIFSEGYVEVYNLETFLYENKKFKKKTILIDPEAVRKTNDGCKHNTIAHECVHWYIHRLYYKMQQYTLPRMARYCKCQVNQVEFNTEEENIMENQAIGIAPRILMPRGPFVEAAEIAGVTYGKDNWAAICRLADFFEVSKQSVSIRLKECGIV